MNTIMFRLKAMPLAASSSVPIRPTITMNTANAPTSREYCSPVGIPNRTSRRTSAGSGRQPASGAVRLPVLGLQDEREHRLAAPTTCERIVPSAAPVTPISGKPPFPKISR